MGNQYQLDTSYIFFVFWQNPVVHATYCTLILMESMQKRNEKRLPHDEDSHKACVQNSALRAKTGVGQRLVEILFVAVRQHNFTQSLMGDAQLPDKNRSRFRRVAVNLFLLSDTTLNLLQLCLDAVQVGGQCRVLLKNGFRVGLASDLSK